MDITQTLYITDRKDWRKWLKEHYKTETEIWLVYPRKATGQPRIEYNATPFVLDAKGRVGHGLAEGVVLVAQICDQRAACLAVIQVRPRGLRDVRCEVDREQSFEREARKVCIVCHGVSLHCHNGHHGPRAPKENVIAVTIVFVPSRSDGRFAEGERWLVASQALARELDEASQSLAQGRHRAVAGERRLLLGHLVDEVVDRRLLHVVRKVVEELAHERDLVAAYGGRPFLRIIFLCDGGEGTTLNPSTVTDLFSPGTRSVILLV